MSPFDREQFAPGRLWSLWDIMKVHKIGALLDSFALLMALGQQWRAHNHDAARMGVQPKEYFSREDYEAVRDKVDTFRDQIIDIGLDVSRVSVDSLKEAIENGEQEGDQYVFKDRRRALVLGALEQLSFVVGNELKARMFVGISAESARLYEADAPLFGKDVAQKFSTGAAFEIDEAAKCMALDRSTAAVFHLMRVLEIALTAIRRSLQLPDPVRAGERNWGAILRTIKDEIERRSKSKPPIWGNPGDPEFYSELYVSLDAVRNVWRNATMHVESKKTPEEAKHIWGAVRGLMVKLASRIDENGQPTA